MRKLFFLLFIFFFLKGAHSQDFYYYQGNRIALEQRTDKMAVVMNSTPFGKDYLQKTLSDMIGSNAEVIASETNVYLINFKDQRSAGEIENMISSLVSRSSNIKFATPVYYGQSRRVSQIPNDQFIVRLRNLDDKDRLEALNISNGIEIIGNIGDERGFLLKSLDNVRKNALALSNDYFTTGIFEFAEPDFMYPEYCLFNMTPNDANYGQQWALNNTGQAVPTGSSSFGDASSVSGIPGADMDVNLAWDFTTGSSTVKVGVLDTGIDSTHPDFAVANHLLAGYDGSTNTNSVVTDPGSHGTATSGLIGAVMNNSIGVAGVAPSCRLMMLKIADGSGFIQNSFVSRSFDTARVRGIDVLSNSWGGGTPAAVVTDAINSAASSGRGGLGCIILFSSGNEGHNPPSYPSYLPNVICVGASTTHDQKKAPGTGNQFWWGGNYGEDINGDIDVTAPTVCYTTDRQGSAGYNTAAGTAGNYFSYFNGTSCSCPNAAGVAALILSVNTAQTRSQVTENLYRGCDKIENVPYNTSKTYGKWNAYHGYGRVNALNSVRLAAGADVTPPTINHANVSSITSTRMVDVTSEILDQNGGSVPNSGSLQPKIFFRMNKNGGGYGAFDSSVAAVIAGNNFTFKINCAGYETQIQYYIKASDNLGNTTTFPRGAPNSNFLCYYAVGTFTTVSNKTGPFTGADPGGTFSPNISFGSFTITNAIARIYLRHTYVSDVSIQLVSPSTESNYNRRCLFARNGGSLDNITGSIVADSAANYWNAGTPPWSNGLYKPEIVLNGYNGTNANGNWRILHYDAAGGDAANYDSVRITLTRTSGTTGPSARLNAAGDSLLNFGTVNYGDTTSKAFYLKNVGTANLAYTAVSFTGTYASKFTLLTSASGSIAPNDSGLFRVRLNTLAPMPPAGRNVAEALENAVMNITNNDPFKSPFKVSLQSDNGVPSAKTLTLTTYIQGFYNSATNLMVRDTVRVKLRSGTTPFAIIDSAKSYITTAGVGTYVFNNPAVSNAVNYYFQTKHRNALETWTKAPGQQFAGNVLAYNLTDDSTKAYGSNQANVDASPKRYALYEGDVDQNGSVSLTDITQIYNASAVFSSGYVVNDINGDALVNLNDISLAFNNSSLFVAKIQP